MCQTCLLVHHILSVKVSKRIYTATSLQIVCQESCRRMWKALWLVSPYIFGIQIVILCISSLQDRIHDDPHSFQDLILTVLQKVCESSTVNIFQLRSCVRYVNNIWIRCKNILTPTFSQFDSVNWYMFAYSCFAYFRPKSGVSRTCKKLYLGIKVMSKWCQSNILK